MKKILLSRTDSIGDVMLTLPLAGIIKHHLPDAQIYFLGKTYTASIIDCCLQIDRFLNGDTLTKEELAQEKFDTVIHVFPNKKLAEWCRDIKILNRIGTSHRYYHWFYCNKTVSFSRKKSDLHEAELNQKLLKPLGIETIYPRHRLSHYIQWKSPQSAFSFPADNKINVVLHMKSKGSAAEWPVSKFDELVKQMSVDQFRFYISGTEEEGKIIRREYDEIFNHKHVVDVTGKFSLEEFIAFIGQIDGLVACSTGPLHIAAVSQRQVLGLYPVDRPMHEGRWGPLGNRVDIINADIKITGEKRWLGIPAEEVARKLRSWVKIN